MSPKTTKIVMDVLPMKRKPTRRDLLIVIGRLQNLIGLAQANNNDRNPDRQAQVDHAHKQAQTLCIEARSFDPPINDSGPWAEETPTKKVI